MFHFINDISERNGHVFQYNLTYVLHRDLPGNQRDYLIFYVSLEGIDLPPELQVIYLTREGQQTRFGVTSGHIGEVRHDCPIDKCHAGFTN